MKAILSCSSVRLHACFALLLIATSLHVSAATVASYGAGVAGNPAVAPSPADAGWTVGNPTSDVGNFVNAGVSPDGATGSNAWRMLDNSSAASQFVTWSFPMTAQQHTDAANNGWRLSTHLRVADPVAGNAGGNSIVLIYGNNAAKRWIAFYDITPTNTLFITLLGSPQLTFNITDTNIATGYNFHEIEFSPVTQRATYRFNGTVLTTNLNNTTGAFNGVQWGTGSTGGKGDSYWNAVNFEIANPPPAPVSIQDPQSATKAVGDSVTFTAVFTNNVNSYQWYQDGTPISGANASSYSIPFVTVYDAGDYVCRATNVSGFGDTAPATLTVLPDTNAPSITSAVGSVFASRVRVRFSEPVDTTSATDIINYGMAGDGFTVNSVTMVDRFTVDVAITPAFVPGSNYTLIVSAVEDFSGNYVQPDTLVPFTTASGFPVMQQLVAAFNGSSAVVHPTDGVTWHDLSGNENNAVSYSSATNTRPTLRTNSIAGHNTLNFLRSAAQALRIEGTNSTGLGSNAYTWFAVSKPTNIAANVFPSLVRHQSSSDAANWGSYFFPGNAGTGNRPGLVSNGRSTTGGEVAAIAAPAPVGQWTLVSGLVNGTTPEVFSRLEVPASNSVVTATNTGTALRSGTPVATWIGTSGAGIASAAFDGEMAEILIYSGALDEAQRAQVESYLRTKYFAVPTVSIRSEGGNVVVDFSGTLLYGDEVTGVTNVVAGATNSVTIPASAAKKFYRSRLP
jgi:hypothetical protein